MELVKSQVVFNQEAHTYMLKGVQLQGITGMLERQLFPRKYEGVQEFILNRAAEKGSFVHEVCEMIDELGVIHEIKEAKNYIAMKAEYELIHEASEYLVSDNEHFASCIDKVFRESEDTFSLGDIKTTYKLDTEYVRWQLSVYAYLFEKQNEGANVNKLYAIWLRGEKSELVEVKRIPSDVIINLLAAEISGLQFNNHLPLQTNNLPTEIQEMEASIIEITKMESYWKEQKKMLMDSIMQQMVKAGEYSWKGENISFTRKKDSIRKTFNKEAFERDYPGVYEKYLTDTPVAGSVTIKIK